MNEPYLLQKGNIIRLKKGMTVNASIPEKFVDIDNPYSTKLTSTEVIIGEVLRNSGVPKKSELINDLTEYLEDYTHYDGITKEIVEAFVNSLNLDYTMEKFDTTVFAGEYCVTQTHSERCGPYFEGYHFPDAWHVFCQKVGEPDVCVDFYQTGTFTPMIPDIMPIKCAK